MMDEELRWGALAMILLLAACAPSASLTPSTAARAMPSSTTSSGAAPSSTTPSDATSSSTAYSSPASSSATAADPAPAAPLADAVDASDPPAHAALPQQTPPQQTREGRLVARMLRRVESARGLASTRTVPGVLLGRAELIARVKDHVSRELPPEAIRDEGLALQLFGFLPTRFDYEAAEYQLLEDQLAGYYEPADQTMYMASDLGEDEATATLAHELVHALQDQHWDLEARSKYQAGEGDRSEAVSALAEGDATSAMFDVMIARALPGTRRSAAEIPDDVFVQQIRRGMSQGPGADAPRIMRSSLAAPYIYGTLFVNALRRRGGWPEVNRAWDAAPTTTEQILHLDKWDAHELALPVGAPRFATLGRGWVVADEDSEGELGARLAFEEWMDPALAAEASSGWGGDRGVLVSNGDRFAFAWRLRFDDAPTKETRAARAFAAVAHALDRQLGPARVSDTNFACRERADRGPIAVGRANNDLLFVLGPARNGPSWTSAGNCALARRWIAEIAAAR